MKNATDTKAYCPEMKSMSINDLLTAMAKKYLPSDKELDIKYIGLQPGENLHEKVMEEGPYSNEVERFTIDEIIKMV